MLKKTREGVDNKGGWEKNLSCELLSLFTKPSNFQSVSAFIQTLKCMQFALLSFQADPYTTSR